MRNGCILIMKQPIAETRGWDYIRVCSTLWEIRQWLQMSWRLPCPDLMGRKTKIARSHLLISTASMAVLRIEVTNLKEHRLVQYMINKLLAMSEGVNHPCSINRRSCNANLRSVSHILIPGIYVRHLVDITVLLWWPRHLPGEIGG